MDRLFITGASGLLGLNLVLQLRDRFSLSGGFHKHSISADSVELVTIDLTSLESALNVIKDFRPQVIIHAAAYADVDGCETNRNLAKRLNVHSTINVAKAASELGAQLIHISTDHLFDGTASWRTESDIPKPLNVYATTKLEAEHAVLSICPNSLIVRTNFYGWGSPLKASLSDWILDGLKGKRDLTMFEDSFFNPILINHLAELIVEMISRKARGIYNVAGRDRISKYSFALRLAEAFGYDTDHIARARISDQNLIVKRPADLSISFRKLEQLIERPAPSLAEGLSKLFALGKEGWPETLRRATTITPAKRPSSKV